LYIEEKGGCPMRHAVFAVCFALYGCMEIPALSPLNPCDPAYSGPWACVIGDDPDGGAWEDIDDPDTADTAIPDVPDVNLPAPDTDLPGDVELPDSGEPIDSGGDLPDVDPPEPDIDTPDGGHDELDSGHEPDGGGEVDPDAGDDAGDVGPEPDADPGDPEPECDCVDDGLPCTVQTCPDGWSCEVEVLAGWRYTGTACEVPVTGVSLNASSLSLNIGQSLMVMATVHPENATDKRIAWASTSAAVSVHSGAITGHAEGVATVQAITIDGGYVGVVVVTVIDPTVRVTGISIGTDSAAVLVGASLPLHATVQPSDASNKSVMWSSSVPGVASVVDGVVNGLAAGESTITAVTIDGNHQASAVVAVSYGVKTCNRVAFDNRDCLHACHPDAECISACRPLVRPQSQAHWVDLIACYYREGCDEWPTNWVLCLQSKCNSERSGCWNN